MGGRVGIPRNSCTKKKEKSIVQVFDFLRGMSCYSRTHPNQDLYGMKKREKITGTTTRPNYIAKSLL